MGNPSKRVGGRQENNQQHPVKPIMLVRGLPLLRALTFNIQQTPQCNRSAGSEARATVGTVTLRHMKGFTMKLNKKQLAQLIDHGKAFEDEGETLRGFVLGLWNKGKGIDPSDITDALKKADLTRAESTVRNWIYAEKKILGMTNENQAGQANPDKEETTSKLREAIAQMSGDEIKGQQEAVEIAVAFVLPYIQTETCEKFDPKRPQTSGRNIIAGACRKAMRAAIDDREWAKDAAKREADNAAADAKADAAKDAKADADAKANAKADKNGTPKGGKRKGGKRKTAPAKATA